MSFLLLCFLNYETISLVLDYCCRTYFHNGTPMDFLKLLIFFFLACRNSVYLSLLSKRKNKALHVEFMLM